MANVLQAGESVPFSSVCKVVRSGQHGEAHYSRPDVFTFETKSEQAART
jgi:hypothetical protein